MPTKKPLPAAIPQKIETFIEKRKRLEDQLENITQELQELRRDVLTQIENLILANEVTVIELKAICDRHNLGRFVEVVNTKNKPVNEIPVNARYKNPDNGKYWTGYSADGKAPRWFKLEKADAYLIPGRNHTKLVRDLVDASGIAIKPIPEAMKKAVSIKELKDVAQQLNRLADSKNTTVLEGLLQQKLEDLSDLYPYCNPEVQRRITELEDL